MLVTFSVPESCCSVFMLLIQVSPFFRNSSLVKVVMAKGFGLGFPLSYFFIIVVSPCMFSERNFIFVLKVSRVPS